MLLNSSFVQFNHLIIYFIPITFSFNLIVILIVIYYYLFIPIILIILYVNFHIIFVKLSFFHLKNIINLNSYIIQLIN